MPADVWHALAMSSANVVIVREVMSLVEDARNGDSSHLEQQIALLRDLVTDDAEIDLSTRVFNPQVYRGIDGMRRLLGEVREVWERWHIVPERFIDAGDVVVVIEKVHARGRGSGVELDNSRTATMWRLRDGRVASLRVGVEINEALKAVGMEE
jgi:ketosteroid isomerase-like protein